MLLLVTGSCPTVTLFQHRENATLVVSMLTQPHMNYCSRSNFLMTQMVFDSIFNILYPPFKIRKSFKNNNFYGRKKQLEQLSDK